MQFGIETMKKDVFGEGRRSLSLVKGRKYIKSNNNDFKQSN